MDSLPSRRSPAPGIQGTSSSSRPPSSIGSSYSRREVTEHEVASIGPGGFSGYAISSQSTYFPSSMQLTGYIVCSSARQAAPKKDLVIPLLQGEFQPSYGAEAPIATNAVSTATSNQDSGSTAPESITQPRKDPYEGQYGLIAPSAGKRGGSANGGAEQAKQPMLSRSRPKGWREIEDEDEKLRFELSARPEADPSAFDRVPIEDFGKAMLRGMGWKPGVNDGAKVVELVRRPERLGLGATPKQPPPGAKKGSAPLEYRDEQGRVRYVKPTDAPYMSASPFLADSTRVAIIAGPHEGMNGRIRRLSQNEKEYIVDLDNDEQVRVLLKEVVSYEQHRADLAKKRANQEAEGYDRRPYDDGYDRPTKKYKTAEVLSEERHTTRHVEPVRQPQLWVTPFIRVKVQNKRFRDGKYYCKKGVIEDIISGTRCAVRLDEGIVLDDIDQSDLETVIPSVGGRIMVVRGPDAGSRGFIREKDATKELVYVQIEDELDIVAFKMDDVAEYVS